MVALRCPPTSLCMDTGLVAAAPGLSRAPKRRLLLRVLAEVGLGVVVVGELREDTGHYQRLRLTPGLCLCLPAGRPSTSASFSSAPSVPHGASRPWRRRPAPTSYLRAFPTSSRSRTGSGSNRCAWQCTTRPMHATHYDDPLCRTLAHRGHLRPKDARLIADEPVIHRLCAPIWMAYGVAHGALGVAFNLKFVRPEAHRRLIVRCCFMVVLALPSCTLYSGH